MEGQLASLKRSGLASSVTGNGHEPVLAPPDGAIRHDLVRRADTARRSTTMQTPKSPKRNDQRSDVKNPNNPAYVADESNRKEQGQAVPAGQELPKTTGTK